MSVRFLLATLAAAMAALPAHAVELRFDFRDASAGQIPPGFVAAVTGPGAVGDWKVVNEEVPPLLAPLSPNAPPTAVQAVLSVASADMAEKRYTALLYTNDTFSDFVLTTRLKITGGIVDPSAGIVFRAQDASNYYVLRAGTQGYLLWHRVVDGKSAEDVGIGVRMPVTKREWLNLKLECKGSHIRCFVDDKLAIPPAKPGSPTENLAVIDTTFGSGQIGFWAKADTEARFAETRIEYTPRIPYIQTVAAQVMRKYPRLLQMDIYAAHHTPTPVIIASKYTNNLGRAGGKVEEDVLKRGIIYFAKDKGWVEITMPLRDRNGDVAAVLKTRLERFPGETQDTALARATIVKKAVEEQFDTMKDIME